MAGGWSRDGAVQEQIDASVADAVKRARSKLVAGEGLSHCEDCDEPIPEGRRKAVPGVRRCVVCLHFVGLAHVLLLRPHVKYFEPCT